MRIRSKSHILIPLPVMSKADMDAFFASIEQRDNPAIRGKPVAVGGTSNRGVVAAASYEARKFGVRSAMPTVMARKKCPELIFMPPRMNEYKLASQIIRSIFLSYTDLVEPLSLDEAYLDMTGCQLHQGSATLAAKAIQQRINEETGLTASAGVSFNKFLAKVSSGYQKGAGLFRLNGENPESIWKQRRFRAQQNGPVRIGDYLYGFDGDSSSRAKLKVRTTAR